MYKMLTAAVFFAASFCYTNFSNELKARLLQKSSGKYLF